MHRRARSSNAGKRWSVCPPSRRRAPSSVTAPMTTATASMTRKSSTSVPMRSIAAAAEELVGRAELAAWDSAPIWSVTRPIVVVAERNAMPVSSAAARTVRIWAPTPTTAGHVAIDACSASSAVKAAVSIPRSISITVAGAVLRAASPGLVRPGHVVRGRVETPVRAAVPRPA